MPGAFNVSLTGSSFATKSAFVLTADEPVAIYASSLEDAEQAARGLRSVGLFELRGYLPHADENEKLEPIEIEELDERARRTETSRCSTCARSRSGTRATSRARDTSRTASCEACVDDLPERPADRHDLLERIPRRRSRRACSPPNGMEVASGLGGGVEDWAERGGKTVQFRRCGT